MKNKKGFTLIELLVTIVIMVSILLLAIVSVSKISSKQKEMAFEKTKEQIITAAKEYFSDNEYFVKSLSSTSEGKGWISLGTLVELDYINSVTNPMTGEKFHKCSYVLIGPDGYDYIYDTDEINEYFGDSACIMDSAVYGDPVKKIPDDDPDDNPGDNPDDNPGEESERLFEVKPHAAVASSCSPMAENPMLYGSEFWDSFKFTTTKKSHTSKWYNNQLAPNGVYLEIVNEINDSFTFAENDSKQICVTVQGNIEKKIKDTQGNEYSLTIKLDTVAPKIIYNLSNSNWTNKDVYVEITLEDSVSKLKSEIRYWNKSGLTESVANSGTHKWTDASVSNTLAGYPTGDSKKIATDEISGKESYTHKPSYSAEGYRKGKINACDIAGNCSFSDEYVIKIDKTFPKMNTIVKKCDSKTDNINDCPDYSNGSWVNKNIKSKMEATDDMSGISNTCYKTSGATTQFTCEGTMRDESIRSSGVYAEGISYFRYETCDRAGNCLNSETCDYSGNCTGGAKGSKLYTVMIDKTAPKIDYYNVVSKNNKYNTANAYVSWNIIDDLSLIGKVSTNIKNSSGNNFWDMTSSKKSVWTLPNTSFVMSNSLNGASITPTLKACDTVGNCSSKNADTGNYAVYKDLKCKIVKTTKPCESDVGNLISGQVQIICNKKITTGEVVYTYDTSSRDCATTTTTYYPNNNYNAVVFNFRGCGGSYILKNAKFEITDGIKTYTGNANGFNLEAESSVAPSCNPERGPKNLAY